jgi:hypothetical protein
MEIRRVYLRRSVKRARLQKRVLVAAMLAATGCAAFLLQAEARILIHAAAPAAPVAARISDGPAPAAARRIDPYSIVPGGVSSRTEAGDGGMLREIGFALDGQGGEGQRFLLQAFPDGTGLQALGQWQAAFRDDSLERMALLGLPWHDRQAGLTLLNMAGGSPAGATEPAAGGSYTSTGSSGDTAADSAGYSDTGTTVVLAFLAFLVIRVASPSTPQTSRPPLTLRPDDRRSSGAAAHQ